MAKINFTAGRVRDFKCPENKQQIFLWDAVTEGLGLRATKGSKNYIFQGKLSGSTIRITIGNIDIYSISEAREQARKLRKLVDEGRDPRVVKSETTAADIAKRKLEKTKQTEALEAWSHYIEARKPKWSERHFKDHLNMSRVGGDAITRGRRKDMAGEKEDGMLLPLLRKPLSEITRDLVTAWLEPEALRRPTRARLALSLLSTFLTWCSNRPEYRDQINPDACRRVKQELPKPKARIDCLQREQLQLWFEHVKKIGNPVMSAYLQCVLLTGARREEMAGIQWSDIDFQWESITIKDKVEGTRTIPLTPYVKSLLLNLQNINRQGHNLAQLKGMKPKGKDWKPSKWVFFSPNSIDGRLREPRIAHNKALTNAGLPSISIHGLRRSFGTLSEWVECPIGICAQLMGHKPSAIAEKHYRQRPLDLLRMWHTKIENWILEQALVKKSISSTHENTNVRLLSQQY